MYGCTHPTPERFAAACKSAANVITELPRGVIGSVYGTHLRRRRWERDRYQVILLSLNL